MGSRQLRQSDQAQVQIPVPATLPTPAVKILAGAHLACGVSVSGQVKCDNLVMYVESHRSCKECVYICIVCRSDFGSPGAYCRCESCSYASTPFAAIPLNSPLP